MIAQLRRASAVVSSELLHEIHEGLDSTLVMLRSKLKQGVTVHRAAELNGVYIPSLCSHKDLSPFGGCRLCMVEIEGMRGYPIEPIYASMKAAASSSADPPISPIMMISGSARRNERMAAAKSKPILGLTCMP